MKSVTADCGYSLVTSYNHKQDTIRKSGSPYVLLGPLHTQCHI